MKLVIDIPDDIWGKVKDGYVPLGISKHLQNGTPLEKVLEDIKAEINRKANSGQWSEATVYGMQKALTIIDKHISGKE